MIVCPVCEHQQAAGFECDRCGKDLGAALSDGAVLAPLAPDVPRMPELEPSGVEGLPNVPVTPMPELEVNIGAAGTANVQVTPMPDLELAVAQVGEVPIEPMPGLDLDRAEFVGDKAPPARDQVQCRYCGNLQAKGALCDKCGMRLPRGSATPQTVEAKAAAKAAAELVRCKFCNSPGHVGQRCGECGRVVVPKER